MILNVRANLDASTSTKPGYPRIEGLYALRARSTRGGPVAHDGHPTNVRNMGRIRHNRRLVSFALEGNVRTTRGSNILGQYNDFDSLNGIAITLGARIGTVARPIQLTKVGRVDSVPNTVGLRKLGGELDCDGLKLPRLSHSTDNGIVAHRVHPADV